jgi:hypothetical protein
MVAAVNQYYGLLIPRENYFLISYNIGMMYPAIFESYHVVLGWVPPEGRL